MDELGGGDMVIDADIANDGECEDERADAALTKLFCGLRNGGSYAFDVIRCG